MKGSAKAGSSGSAREAAGEDLAIYAMRPTTDARFHPQLAQVRAPVTHLPRAHRLTTEWEAFTKGYAELPGFADRFASVLGLLVRMDPSDAAQAVELAGRDEGRRPGFRGAEALEDGADQAPAAL